MKIALCNEVLREMDFAEQCDYVASLGYDGLELAPFTLGEQPHLLEPTKRRQIRRSAQESGIEIVGLHWLLVSPPGLSINSPDRDVRSRTAEVMCRLVDLCADLGGKVLVHGSPAQRQVPQGEDRSKAWERAKETFSKMAPEAEAAGVVYCLEPLSRQETNFINNLAEAIALVEAVGNSAFRTMLDSKAARLEEELAAEQLIDQWLPSGMIAHVHVNDRNRRGPGQGEDRFSALLSALLRNSYQGVVSVEPFDYVPDGPGAAARAIGYLKGILENLGADSTGSGH